MWPVIAIGVGVVALAALSSSSRNAEKKAQKQAATAYMLGQGQGYQAGVQQTEQAHTQRELQIQAARSEMFERSQARAAYQLGLEAGRDRFCNTSFNNITVYGAQHTSAYFA